MSWYVDLNVIGNTWHEVEGPFLTKEVAETALTRRSQKQGMSINYYRVREQRDTVPAGPENGIPAADVNAMAIDSKIAFAAKKVPLEMVTSRELQGPGRVKQYGAKKHGKGNYLKASLSDGAGERYVGALLRHVGEMQNPDGTWDAKSLGALDEESGLPHIDHAICSLLMLRGILIKDGVLPADPGEGKEPPKR